MVPIATLFIDFTQCKRENIYQNNIWFFFITRDGGEGGAVCECGEGRGEVADHKPRWGAVSKRSVDGFPLVYL